MKILKIKEWIAMEICARCNNECSEDEMMPATLLNKKYYLCKQCTKNIMIISIDKNDELVFIDKIDYTKT